MCRCWVTASPEYSQHKGKEKPVREKSLAGERNTMFELLLLILFLICYGFYRLCRCTMCQVQREQIFFSDLRRCGYKTVLQFYNIAKAILWLIIIGGTFYIFAALAYGGCPTITDLTNPKFQEVLLGIAIILLPQMLVMWYYKFFRQ